MDDDLFPTGDLDLASECVEAVRVLSADATPDRLPVGLVPFAIIRTRAGSGGFFAPSLAFSSWTMSWNDGPGLGKGQQVVEAVRSMRDVLDRVAIAVPTEDYVDLTIENRSQPGQARGFRVRLSDVHPELEVVGSTASLLWL